MLIAIQPSNSDAAKKKKKKPPVKKQVAPSPPSTLSDLSEPPPAEAFAALLEWASSEADRLRAAIAKSPKDERGRVLMASLTVAVTTDLERAMSLGDTDSA